MKVRCWDRAPTIVSLFQKNNSPPETIVGRSQPSNSPWGSAVAQLELLPAAARARVVAPRGGEGFFQRFVFSVDDLHHIRRCAALPQLVDHHPHRAVHMHKERFVARAQVIERGFAIAGDQDAVLGAPAVADKAHLAVNALLRKLGQLVLTECALFFRCDQVDKRCFHNIPQQILGFHVVVASVKVAVVLHG